MEPTDTSIINETRDRYLTYALSVVTGRALPDIRDGLKPVQRRILFTMHRNLGLGPSSNHRKSAAVVGEVLGKFHPHSDVACYEAMVRMAQDFSLRYPLVDGQGNFGSMDGDNAAAYRYTEAKLNHLALEVIGEIDEETVTFRANFDSTTEEPVVFPSRIPNLLINGSMGIAVGMATSIPPHNLKDTVKALIDLSQDPELSNAQLANIVKGPDFPNGCLILNTQKEISDTYKTGRGTIRMRGEWNIEDQARGKRFVIITSIPYAVNKAQLVEKIANLIIDKKVPQLTDIRDESTDVVRVVLELATDADPEVAMAYLYKNTPLDSNFNVNLTALVPEKNGALRPQLVSLKECLQHFLEFRKEVVEKKLIFERKKLEERIHILEGLAKIFDDLDAALKIVRKSDGRSDAAEKLRARFKLTEIQAFAVVDMRIYQLSKTNIDDVLAELKVKSTRVAEITAILKNKKKIADIVRKELEEIGEKYGDKRRCKLVKDNIEVEFRAEDYVVNEDVFAIVTRDGWIKRIRRNNELSSTRLREGDAIVAAHALSTVDSVAFLTNQGSLYVLKVSDFPSSSGYGDPIQKILKFKDGEAIAQSLAVQAAKTDKKADPTTSLAEGREVIFVTKRGMGFRSTISGLDSVKRNGKRVIKVRDGDALVAAIPPAKRVLMFTKGAVGLSIDTKEVPVREGASVGVVLMGVRPQDELIAAISVSGSTVIELELGSGNTKEIKSSEMTEGRRALKGTKVVARGELSGARKPKGVFRLES